MSSDGRSVIGLVGGTLASVVLTVAAAAFMPALAADAPKPCCFTNEQFAGVCRVVPDKDESCDSILAYLNNPNSTGRSYCERTNIRGGWVQVNCETGKPPAKTSSTAVSARASTQAAPPAQSQP